MPAVSMKSNINQNYSGNDQVIKDQGCAVCCATDVASSYGNVYLTLAQMRDTYLVYDSRPLYFAGPVWGNVPYADIDTYTTTCNESTCLAKIVDEVDANRLILVYMEGRLSNGNYTTHYAVAYGYTYGGTSTYNISVFDPYTGSSSATTCYDQPLITSLTTQGSTLYGPAAVKGYRLCRRR